MTVKFRQQARVGCALLLAGVLSSACSVNDREHKPFQPQGQARILEKPLPTRNYTSLYPAIPSVDPALRQQQKQVVMQLIGGKSLPDALAALTARGFRCYENRCSYGRIRQHENGDGRVYLTENTVIEMRPSAALADNDVNLEFAVLSFRQPD